MKKISILPVVIVYVITTLMSSCMMAPTTSMRQAEENTVEGQTALRHFENPVLVKFLTVQPNYDFTAIKNQFISQHGNYTLSNDSLSAIDNESTFIKGATYEVSVVPIRNEATREECIMYLKMKNAQLGGIEALRLVTAKELATFFKSGKIPTGPVQIVSFGVENVDYAKDDLYIVAHIPKLGDEVMFGFTKVLPGEPSNNYWKRYLLCVRQVLLQKKKVDRGEMRSQPFSK